MENESLAMEKSEYLMPKINDSVSDLRTCFEILEQVESVSVVDEVSRRVHSAMVDAAMAFDFLGWSEQSQPSRASNIIAIPNTEEKSKADQILFLLCYLPSSDHRWNTFIPECIASLSSFIPKKGRNKVNPDDIFAYSHILASSEMNGLASLTKSLILISTESRSAVPYLRRCASLIDDSLHKMNSSFAASTGFELFSTSGDINNNIQEEKIRDMKPWVNGSVSDLRSCFDLLQTVKDDDDSSRAVDELKGRVQIAMTYASNSFDFLQNRNGIINQIESWNEYQSSESVVDYAYLSIILFMFFPQYLVLVILYFLLLRKY